MLRMSKCLVVNLGRLSFGRQPPACVFTAKPAGETYRRISAAQQISIDIDLATMRDAYWLFSART
jgi:hypothetical protein